MMNIEFQNFYQEHRCRKRSRGASEREKDEREYTNVYIVYCEYQHTIHSVTIEILLPQLILYSFEEYAYMCVN